MPEIEVPVSTDDSMIAHAPAGPNQKRSTRVAMCFVVALLVALATPWNVEAAPSSAHQPDSSQMYAAAPGDNDGDGMADEIDPDDDNDQVMDEMDPHPFTAGPTPEVTPDIIAPDQDSDDDHIDNIMDPDDDNDTIEDDEDPAPFTPAPPVVTPDSPVDTPVPPTEVPTTPDTDEPAPAPPDSFQAQQPAPQLPSGPAIDEPEPFAVQTQSQDSAPLVVALPSTGGTGDVEPDSSSRSLLVTLAAVLGTSASLLRRRSSRSAFQS